MGLFKGVMYVKQRITLTLTALLAASLAQAAPDNERFTFDLQMDEEGKTAPEFFRTLHWSDTLYSGIAWSGKSTQERW